MWPSLLLLHSSPWASYHKWCWICDVGLLYLSGVKIFSKKAISRVIKIDLELARKTARGWTGLWHECSKNPKSFGGKDQSYDGSKISEWEKWKDILQAWGNTDIYFVLVSLRERRITWAMLFLLSFCWVSVLMYCNTTHRQMLYTNTSLTLGIANPTRFWHHSGIIDACFSTPTPLNCFSSGKNCLVEKKK